MSGYGRPPRQAAYSGDKPVDFRALRYREGVGPSRVRRGQVTVDMVAEPESLIAAYDRLAARGGPAPGRDRVTYADLGRSEVCAALRELSRIVLSGSYRPAASRGVRVLKADRRRWREIRLRGILDRVVSAALDHALSPLWESRFSDRSFGFRPAQGVWTLLDALEADIDRSGRVVLAQDDVRDAFPSVVIEDLLEDHRERIADPRLLILIEAVVRGGDEPGRALGIAQGDPYSPTCLNVRLHAAHDAPLTRDVADCSWFRYADNLAYLAEGTTEGRELLDRARSLLMPAGLALKGEDGPPVDLSEGEAPLLGFRLRWAGDRLRLRPGDDAWDELTRHLGDAREHDDPTGAARRAVSGWVSAYGPAFETTTVAAVADQILSAAATQGLRELSSAEDLRGRMRDAHRRWQDLREGGRGRRDDRFGGTDRVRRSAPTIAPGVPS